MSILDTTIVNVALETLRIELGAPLSTIQWVSTGYLLALATAIPLTGWAAERFGPKRVWMTAVARVRRDERPVRSGVERRVADRLPRAPGLRRRDDHADRDDHAGAGRRARAHGPRDEHRRRAHAAGPGARSRDRRRDRREPVVALDLLREPAGRDRRAAAGAPAAAVRPRGRAVPRPTGTSTPCSTGAGWRSLSPGVGAIVFGISEYGAHRTFATAERLAAARPRPARGRRLRRARPAHALPDRSTSACSARAASRPRRPRSS